MRTHTRPFHYSSIVTGKKCVQCLWQRGLLGQVTPPHPLRPRRVVRGVGFHKGGGFTVKHGVLGGRAFT